jgi:predicted RNase H-like HicB family nuclease
LREALSFALKYAARKFNPGNMNRHFTAVIKKDDGWWIGWVEEIPGVNSQGKTRGGLLKNLRSALKEALEFNRQDALAAGTGGYPGQLSFF